MDEPENGILIFSLKQNSINFYEQRQQKNKYREISRVQKEKMFVRHFLEKHITHKVLKLALKITWMKFFMKKLFLGPYTKYK